MNENLNLVEILKDCPKGTKLYSTIYGDVELVGVHLNDNAYPIEIKIGEGSEMICDITNDGRLLVDFTGECTLFPSREQRDWSKFITHWLEKQGKDKIELNNFDVLPGLYKCVHRMFDGTPDGKLLFEIDNVYKCLSKHDRAEFEVSYGHSVYLEDPVVCKYFIPFEDKDEKKSADKTEPKFKVGNKIVNIPQKYIGDSGTQGIISKITDDKYIFTDGSYIFISNQDSWELVPDKKPKFDPRTLQPFDKVLIRDEDCESWNCGFFSHKGAGSVYSYRCVGTPYTYCIPYNDDTKHLVGTNDEAPEFYRYWED